MSEEYKMQRIKEYLIFHIKDSKERRELLDYLDQLQQKDKELEARKQLIIKQDKELWTLENIIKEVREKLDTQLIETVSEQFNYQCATKIIEQAKQILDKENK